MEASAMTVAEFLAARAKPEVRSINVEGVTFHYKRATGEDGDFLRRTGAEGSRSDALLLTRCLCHPDGSQLFSAADVQMLQRVEISVIKALMNEILPELSTEAVEAEKNA